MIFAPLLTAALSALVTLPMAAQGALKWEHDLDSALKRARAENKLVFLDLWAEWCPPCLHLKDKVFPAPAVVTALSRMVPLSVVVEKKDRTPVPAGMALAERFRMQAYPTLIILDAQGRELRRQQGAFRTAEDLAAWLNAGR